MDFAVPADHRVKFKESETKDKYLDLARELKKLWNMKVTIIPIVIVALGLIKGLEDLEIKGRVETIQTTALLRSARILRRFLETWGDLLKDHQLTLMWKTLKEYTIIIIMIIKLMVMHEALHSRDDVDRLHVSNKEGIRGHVSIQSNIDASIQRLQDYIKKNGGKLITAIRNSTDNTSIKRI